MGAAAGDTTQKTTLSRIVVGVPVCYVLAIWLFVAVKAIAGSRISSDFIIMGGSISTLILLYEFNTWRWLEHGTDRHNVPTGTPEAE